MMETGNQKEADFYQPKSRKAEKGWISGGKGKRTCCLMLDRGSGQWKLMGSG